MQYECNLTLKNSVADFLFQDWLRHKRSCVPLGFGSHAEGIIALVPSGISGIRAYVFWPQERMLYLI